ncbi:MAG: sulfatase-like hydrolase/transferase [Vicinamibacterales bacterium]
MADDEREGAAPPGSRDATGRRRVNGLVLLVAALGVAAGCGSQPSSAPKSGEQPAARPSILLVTLDTTRADSIGPDAIDIRTPSFNAVAARGRLYRQAYATVPETLPSHASLMTGLYAAGHAVHENARRLADTTPVLAERLKGAGYRTAAVVASFVLARRFGLARGFDVYDDRLPQGRQDRTAAEVTDAALAALGDEAGAPVFMWVHYWDPHHPYSPPEPFRSAHPKRPYLGEVAFMDAELGRLLEAFERRANGPTAIILVGDHGEGLGDHGESQHGNLLYQSTMHVPLAVAGPGVAAGVVDAPVSIRRVYHTIVDWAGLGSADSLRGDSKDVVLGEAMKPFLEYGWQPQIMAVQGRQKAIFAGATELYDVVADPREVRNLARGAEVPALLRTGLDEYPVPSPEAARAPSALSAEDRQQLASLGYVSATAAPAVRKDAPRPADMVRLFDALEEASTLFVQANYAQVIPLLERILSEDRYNLDATLRLATARSALGQDAGAMEAFRRARELAPRSEDVKLYLALHLARGRDWAQAVPALEEIVAASPERLPAVEGLAALRARQGRLEDAVGLTQKAYELKTPAPAEWVHLGEMAMAVTKTGVAIDAFERARGLQGPAFRQDLELGVLYLSARRFEDARAALDRVPASHPAYPMALFKRAQVSVILQEPDAPARIAEARRRADATTRDLVARERLFR